jgi:hypothetical protein
VQLIPIANFACIRELADPQLNVRSDSLLSTHEATLWRLLADTIMLSALAGEGAGIHSAR